MIHELFRRGHRPDAVIRTLLDDGNKISEHVHDQSDPLAYAQRQVAKARKNLNFRMDNKGKLLKDQGNIRIALLKMDVVLRCDEFSGRTLVEGVPDYGPLDDATMDHLWLLVDIKYHFKPTKDDFITVLEDTARLHRFHPVRDYLDGLTWDVVKRLDEWLITYGGAADTPYVRASAASR